MNFMNASEVEWAMQKHKNHPILGKATKVLYNLMESVNTFSDGWHSWPKPCRAAGQLMTLIQNPHDVTEDAYKKALTPIKRFCTKYKDKISFAELTI